MFTSGDQGFWQFSEEQLEQTYDNIHVLPFITLQVQPNWILYKPLKLQTFLPKSNYRNFFS